MNKINRVASQRQSYEVYKHEFVAYFGQFIKFVVFFSPPRSSGVSRLFLAKFHNAANKNIDLDM